MSDQPEIVVLPLDEIQENAWNPNYVRDEVMAALVANVRRVGFQQPLLVRPNTGAGRAYEIVDGAHRYRAARAAGLEFVPCVVQMIDEAEAKAQTIAMNQIRGEMDPSHVAALIRDIDSQGINLDQLADFSGFTDAELRDLDRLLDIDWEQESRPKPRTTPQGDDERWVDVRVRVPHAVAVLFRAELERLSAIRETDHDHLALELMILNSSQTPPEAM